MGCVRNDKPTHSQTALAWGDVRILRRSLCANGFGGLISRIALCEGFFMAGDWVKWVKGLASRREVIVIASKMRRDPHEIAGRLMVFWEWCDENFSDDDVVGENVSLILGDNCPAFVDALCGLPGMADALSTPEVNWLQFRSGGQIVFPNLARHNGTSAKTRAYDQKKKKAQRNRASPKCPRKKGTREEKSVPPNPHSGGMNVGRRPRDHFKPLANRDRETVRAWVGEHDDQFIPHDQLTVEAICRAAAEHQADSDFAAAVDRIRKGATR